MTFRVIALILATWLVPVWALANDCDEVKVKRNNKGFTVKRFVLADGKTTNTTSLKCTLPSLDPTGGMASTPWDFYRIFGEEGNTCTSWTAAVRDYPTNDSTSTPPVCRGTCDPHTLTTLAKGATTSQTFKEPLGEAMEVVTSGVVCADGASIFIDFYWRNQEK